MVIDYGMSTTLGDVNLSNGYEYLSPETKTKIESEIRQTLEQARVRGTEILTAHRNELEKVARALIEYETLTRDEMIKVMKGEKLPKLTTTKGDKIKIPEIVLPPGIVSAAAGAAGTAVDTGEEDGGSGRSGTGSNPPEGGSGGVKM